jgi:hypothetical protein
MRDKSFSYFELRDACNGPGCPLCRVLARKVHRYLDSFFYENVNDPSVREKLRDGLGFCRTHALKAVTMGDALGVAIIYQDLLDVVVGQPSEERLPHASKKCPVCAQRRHFEQSYVDTLLEYRDDLELQRAFKASDGPCLYHLHRLSVHKNGNALPAWIRSLTGEKLEERRRRLSEFLRKQDVRAKNERLSEREETACEDAIDFLVGMSD